LRRKNPMQYRELGRTGWKVSTVSFGAWAIGGSWGSVDDRDSLAALHRAIDLGVNFVDTADVYGDGRSERLIARLRKERKENIYVATKAGRRLDPHLASGYNRKNLTAFVERSLKNLDTEVIDLLQLHCPPTEVYYMPETFGVLDDLVKAGKLRHYGVSVEKVEEALKAIEYPDVQTVQIIFNIFRQRPIELFFGEASRRKVGILARVPLASGLLTGKLSPKSSFEADDHRAFNRHGESFDRGETFSGVDYETGLKAVDELRGLVPAGWSMPQFALRWILMFDAVTCTIPGAKNPKQAEDNVKSADLPQLDPATMEKIRAVYMSHIRPLVHQYW
jgi:aryl-alcohol dehydrogenase-like predicted oxidoreductase